MASKTTTFGVIFGVKRLGRKKGNTIIFMIERLKPVFYNPPSCVIPSQPP